MMPVLVWDWIVLFGPAVVLIGMLILVGRVRD